MSNKEGEDEEVIPYFNIFNILACRLLYLKFIQN